MKTVYNYAVYDVKNGSKIGDFASLQEAADHLGITVNALRGRTYAHKNTPKALEIVKTSTKRASEEEKNIDKCTDSKALNKIVLRFQRLDYYIIDTDTGKEDGVYSLSDIIEKFKLSKRATISNIVNNRLFDERYFVIFKN